MTLTLALSYGGRAEIVDAIRKIACEVKNGDLEPDQITEETVSGSLYQPELPDPDLLIRTSGEMRISNFLLWQISYTELWVTPVLWPDFRREHFWQAMESFGHRNRRFGRVTTPQIM
jgi:undecaprenyl diphosphate synthase